MSRDYSDCALESKQVGPFARWSGTQRWSVDGRLIATEFQDSPDLPRCDSPVEEASDFWHRSRPDVHRG